MSRVHAVLRAAARGELPSWAQVDERRRGHLARVAALLTTWADALALPSSEQERWGAAGWLHDSLRLASAAELRPLVPAAYRDLPGKVLHGPAAAARLRAEGVTDEPLLLAIACHTIGHPELDQLGQALYAADFLEPGRSYDPLLRATLRARMPASLPVVVQTIIRLRLTHMLRHGRTVRPETLAFWNRTADHARA